MEDTLEQVRKIKAQLLEVKSKKVDFIREHALWFFKPYTTGKCSQVSFFDHADYYLRAVFAGNRWGKSLTGVAEDISWLLGYRPFFDENDRRRNLGIPAHGVKGLVLVEDWDMVNEVFTQDIKGDRMGKIWKYLPKKYLAERPRKNQNGIIDFIAVKSDLPGPERVSTIQFDTVRSFMQHAGSAESKDWDFIHVDEPIPKDMWTAHSRGLIDRNGKTWWLMTSMKHAWMYRQANEDVREGKKVFFGHGSMHDNPYNTAEAKDNYLRQIEDEDERLARESGIPIEFSGLVYGGFNLDIHRKKECPHGWASPLDPPKSYTIHYAIDPHPQTPHAVLFAACSPTGETYFYDEIFQKASIAELAAEIKKRLVGRQVGWQLCDPIAWIENPETQKIWAQTFWRAGLYVRKASKSKTEGIIRCRDLWRKRPPSVFVLEHMRRFLYEIGIYNFDKENKPVDKDDHMMENMYRLELAGLNYMDMTPFSGELLQDEDPMRVHTESSELELSWNV